MISIPIWLIFLLVWIVLSIIAWFTLNQEDDFFGITTLLTSAFIIITGLITIIIYLVGVGLK